MIKRHFLLNLLLLTFLIWFLTCKTPINLGEASSTLETFLSSIKTNDYEVFQLCITDNIISEYNQERFKSTFSPWNKGIVSVVNKNIIENDERDFNDIQYRLKVVGGGQESFCDIFIQKKDTFWLIYKISFLE